MWPSAKFVLMCGLAAWHPPGERPFQYHHTTIHCKNTPRNYKDTIKYVALHMSAKLSSCILKKQKQLSELAVRASCQSFNSLFIALFEHIKLTDIQQ